MAKKKNSTKNTKEASRVATEGLASTQMRNAIKKQGTSKSSQTVADQAPLADEAAQTQNRRG